MTEKIKVTEMLSQCDGMVRMGMKLWLTPGSDRPYWANTACFTHDQIVATPWDFLEEAGYDCFNDDHDYSGCDEEITIQIDFIDPAPYLG